VAAGRRPGDGTDRHNRLEALEPQKSPYGR
jgi:hypothetical protein